MRNITLFLILVLFFGTVYADVLHQIKQWEKNLYEAVKKGNEKHAQHIYNRLKRKYYKLSSKLRKSLEIQWGKISFQEVVDKIKKDLALQKEKNQKFEKQLKKRTHIEGMRVEKKDKIFFRRVVRFGKWVRRVTGFRVRKGNKTLIEAIIIRGDHKKFYATTVIVRKGLIDDYYRKLKNAQGTLLEVKKGTIRHLPKKREETYTVKNGKGKVLRTHKYTTVWKDSCTIHHHISFNHVKKEKTTSYEVIRRVGKMAYVNKVVTKPWGKILHRGTIKYKGKNSYKFLTIKYPRRKNNFTLTATSIKEKHRRVYQEKTCNYLGKLVHSLRRVVIRKGNTVITKIQVWHHKKKYKRHYRQRHDSY